MCYVYHSFWIRFIWILYFICICGKRTYFICICGKRTVRPECFSPCGLKSWTQLSDWTELWEEINTDFQMYPFQPLGSSATHKFLDRLDVHVTFVWVLTALRFYIPRLHCIPWRFLNRPPPLLSVMIYRFISFCKDGLLSHFNPWFKIHSIPISHFFLYCYLRVCYLYFHLFDFLNGATGPGL